MPRTMFHSYAGATSCYRIGFIRTERLVIRAVWCLVRKAWDFCFFEQKPCKALFL